MKNPKICATFIKNDLEPLKEIEPLVDLFEVRIDLIGEGWQEVARQLEKPWIGCNRVADEGGGWKGGEEERIDELMKAVELGADIIDIELATRNLEKLVPSIKKRAQCLLSFHDLKGTPPLEKMKEIIEKQLLAGADICKLVTTARNFEDNMATLQLISAFPGIRLVSLAMGPYGLVSRVLCPLAGGDFIYASIESGKESAPGQLTVRELRNFYEMVSGWRTDI